MLITLAGDSRQQSRDRYTLGTLLSALGVPYQFAGEVPTLEPVRQHVAALVDPHRCLELSAGSSPCSSLVTHHSSLDTIFEMIARSEEYTVGSRDQYERFGWAHTTVQPPDAALQPTVSTYGRELLARLREAHTQSGLPMISKEPWPEGRSMAACLTHDLDTVRRGRLPRGVTGKDARGVLSAVAHGRLGEAAGRSATILRTATGPNPYWSFDRVATLEGEFGFHSTYFVMAGRVHPQDASYELSNPRMARLLGTLLNHGCEIGLHGSFGSYADGDSLHAQKTLLETRLGTTVAGHRNHVLRFNVPDSWRAHQTAGFAYDATLGFADHEGFRGGHAFPFHPYDAETEQPLDLLEIPLAVMDVTIHKYRGLRDEEARRAVETVLGQTLDVNGLVTLLWHNDTFYDPDYPGCGRLYELALDWLAGHDCWVARCLDVDRWWRARDAVEISSVDGSSSGWRIEAGRDIDGLVLRVSLPDPSGALRLSNDAGASINRDGSDYLIRLGRLAAGSSTEIRL